MKGVGGGCVEGMCCRGWRCVLCECVGGGFPWTYLTVASAEAATHTGPSAQVYSGTATEDILVKGLFS